MAVADETSVKMPSRWCDLEAFRATPLVREPFPYLIVPRFIPADALAAVEHDFPRIARAGSFPLPSLTFGARFQAMIEALRGPEFTGAVEEKFGIDLEGRPTMVTVRGTSGMRDGHIHTDSVTKLITVLVYMNGKWEPPGGRLRLLRRPDALDDVIAEVPPDEGTLLIFKNQPNAWHGYEPFEGIRRVIQLNWVTSHSVVFWEQTRHRLSAALKSVAQSRRAF